MDYLKFATDNARDEWADPRLYELRADGVRLWKGRRYPKQIDIDWAASNANGCGWNGVTLDLYHGLDWVAFCKPSEEVLS